MKAELHLPDLPEVPVALSPLSAPDDDQQRRTRPSWPVRLREGIVGYLPLMLMVALALGTWLIAKNTPGLLSPSTPGVVKHEADYTLDHFTLQRFDPTGALKVEIEGEHMQHFPDDDIMEVEQIRVVTTEPDGRRMIATALHGRARGDSSEVWLDGQAQVVSESAGRTADPDERRAPARAAQAAPGRLKYMVLVRQGDSEFNADGLEYDDNTRLLTLHGNVHALMQPSLRKSVAEQERRRAMRAPLLFITGASSGIGQAMALEWARRGGRLALVAGGRRDAGLGGGAGLVARARRGLRGRRARHGRDDRCGPRLHRGAGAARRRHRERWHQRRRRLSVEADLEVLRAVIETNNLGMAATFQPFIAPMCARRSGRLVGIASVAGIRDCPAMRPIR